MKSTAMIRFAMVAAALALLPASALAGAMVAAPMTGHWAGQAHVIVTWCQQQDLPVSLVVHSDGSVSGTVGDAALANATLTPRQMWFGWARDTANAYVVTGQLKGSVVAAEQITRDRVFIHLRFENSSYSGSLATSGWKIGGKERMALTATELRLAKRE